MPYWIAPALGCLFMLVTIGAALYTARQARIARNHRIGAQITGANVERSVAQGARQVEVAIVLKRQVQEIADRVREENEITQPLAVPYGVLTSEVYDEEPRSMRGEDVAKSGKVLAFTVPR